MARPLRIQFPGAIYHVTFRGNERRAIFGDDRDRERFLAQLSETSAWAGVRLYLVCLMPNHVHLLVETPRGNLSAFMGRLVTAYAVYFNLRRRRSGHVTQGRYKAQIVEGDRYLLKLSRYIHLNPVQVKAFRDHSTAERLKALKAYRWSSFRSYAGLEKRWRFIDYEPVLNQVAGTGRGRVAKYRAFVESGLAQSDEEFHELYKQAGLSVGSESFQERVRRLYQGASRKAIRPEDVSFRRRSGVASPERVIEVVADVLGMPAGEFTRRRRGLYYRTAAVWALYHFAGMDQRAVGRRLGMETGSAVSQHLAGWKKLVAKDKTWTRHQNEIERQLPDQPD